MKPVTKSINQYFKKYEEGDFHIVIGDSNVRDCDLDFCLKIARQRYEDAISLVNELKAFSKDENIRAREIIKVVKY